MTRRWAVEQVLAVAPRPSSVAAAQPLAVPSRWSGLGCDERAVWGRCGGSGAEPYDTAVDHSLVAYRCSCPSRLSPCKHALALLLIWARGQVPTAAAPAGVARWIATQPSPRPERDATPSKPGDLPAGASDDGERWVAPSADAGPGVLDVADVADVTDVADATDVADHGASRDDRVRRMAAGLAELDRWLDDRVRTGLADPALARYATWDGLAARLVDAQVGGLANRVRRLAGMVGARPEWHDDVLAEIGVLHLLARAGRHLHDLPSDLADSVALALGWQVRQADVLAGVPETDHWTVMARSDVREDRIEVRRVWLLGRDSGRWAMVLSFAAYRQALDASLTVGTTVHADVFRYPGRGTRVLIGPRHAAAEADGDLCIGIGIGIGVGVGGTVVDAAAAIGAAYIAEPWVERVPVSFVAAPARATVGGRWVLTDHSGSLPLAPTSARAVAQLLACSAGMPVALTGEWTAGGVLPLSIHLADRTVDIGPVADAAFADPGLLAS